MQKIFVSVGIPMYNAEKFISYAIQSVLSQTHFNFELIITDDGSSDKSIEIVKSIVDPRIILLSDGENKGISYRLHQQIELAQGKYFFRMDADDIMFPDRIKKQVDFLEKNPDVDVVGSSCVVIGDGNEILGFRSPANISTLKETLYKVSFIHPTVAGKTNWFKVNKYSLVLSGVEDFELWHRTFVKSKFFNLPEPLMFYRDPLTFKINTYLFRHKQIRKVYRSSKFLFDKPCMKSFLIFKSKVKDVIASSVTVFKIDRFLIKNRNQHLNKIEDLDSVNSILCHYN